MSLSVAILPSAVRTACVRRPAACAALLPEPTLAHTYGCPHGCRLLLLEPALTVDQLALLLSCCCKLTYAVLALSQLDLRLVQLAPEEGGSVQPIAGGTLGGVCSDAFSLLWGALQRSEPPADDAVAAAAWDR